VVPAAKEAGDLHAVAARRRLDLGEVPAALGFLLRSREV